MHLKLLSGSALHITPRLLQQVGLAEHGWCPLQHIHCATNPPKAVCSLFSSTDVLCDG